MVWECSENRQKHVSKENKIKFYDKRVERQKMGWMPNVHDCITKRSLTDVQANEIVYNIIELYNRICVKRPCGRG